MSNKSKLYEELMSDYQEKIASDKDLSKDTKEKLEKMALSTDELEVLIEEVSSEMSKSAEDANKKKKESNPKRVSKKDVDEEEDVVESGEEAPNKDNDGEEAIKTEEMEEEEEVRDADDKAPNTKDDEEDVGMDESKVAQMIEEKVNEALGKKASKNTKKSKTIDIKKGENGEKSASETLYELLKVGSAIEDMAEVQAYQMFGELVKEASSMSDDELTKVADFLTGQDNLIEETVNKVTKAFGKVGGEAQDLAVKIVDKAKTIEAQSATGKDIRKVIDDLISKMKSADSTNPDPSKTASNLKKLVKEALRR